MENKITNYYTVEKHLNDVFEKEARQMPAVSNSAEFAMVWQKAARKKLWELLSLNKFSTCELKPQIVEKYKTKQFIREKVVFNTEEDVKMPAFVMMPAHKSRKKIPFVLLIPGHGAGKLMMVHAIDYQEVKAACADPEQREQECLALKLVTQGYGVVAIDTRGAGERRERWHQSDNPKNFFTCSHDKLNKMAITLGYSLTGMNVWDAIKTIDYIQNRPEFDGRLFCGGHSGGGMLSLYLSAIDERIQGTFVSGYFYGFWDALFRQPNNCACNFIPNMWRYFDVCDIAAMIAPRPLFIETGDNDSLNGRKGLDNVLPQVKETKKVYRCFDAEEKLSHVIYSGGHDDGFKRQEVIEFISRFLRI